MVKKERGERDRERGKRERERDREREREKERQRHKTEPETAKGKREIVCLVRTTDRLMQFLIQRNAKSSARK